MDIWTIWLIAAILLLIVEVPTQMMWALCLTIGATGAMLLSSLVSIRTLFDSTR